MTDHHYQIYPRSSIVDVDAAVLALIRLHRQLERRAKIERQYQSMNNYWRNLRIALTEADG